MKTCNECGETKAVGEFYYHHGRHVARCKSCYCRKTKVWKSEHQTPEHVVRWEATRKASKARIKDAVFGAYGGYVCACCGETERAFLSIDHIWNDGADWRRSTLGSRLATGWQTYRWLFQHSFPAGFQVLCMNCNFGKRMNGGKCPHSVRCNDYPLVGVGSSDPKRSASALADEDIVFSTVKAVAARSR